MNNLNKILKDALTIMRFDDLLIMKRNIPLIQAAIAEYEDSDEKGRQLIRNIYGENDYLKLLSLSDWLIVEAFNIHDPDLLKYSILLHSIEAFRFDQRENIRRLSLLWYVSKKVHQEPQKLFEYATTISSEKVAECFKEFIKEPDSMKSLKSMGLYIKKENGRNIFVPELSPWD